MAIGSVFSRSGRTAYRRPDPRLVGLLALALLALVVSLLWPTVVARWGPIGSSDGAAASGPTRLTYRQPDAGGALLPREAAVASVLRFTGWEQAELTGDLETGQDGPAYFFDTPARGDFRVDAYSGEVLEASLPERLAVAPLGRQLEPALLEQRAADQARDRFLDFDSLTLVERSASWGANGHLLHRFKWARLDDATGAELPTSVAVALTADQAELVWYLAQRTPLTVDPRPRVSREQAVAAAAATAEQLGRGAPGIPSAVRLQVIFDEHNVQRLAWSITFRGEPDATGRVRPALRLVFDARTGQPLAGP